MKRGEDWDMKGKERKGEKRREFRKGEEGGT